MFKRKLEKDPLYQKALYLQRQIKSLNHEIALIDEALAQIQIDRVTNEIQYNTKTTPLWGKWFAIKKSSNTNKFFAEPSSYNYEKAISISEAEFMFLRGFKQSRIDEINKQITELSRQISED